MAKIAVVGGAREVERLGLLPVPIKAPGSAFDIATPKTWPR